MIERQTYSMLELLGDVGGLHGALSVIAATIISPLATFAMKAQIMTSSYRSVRLKPRPKALGSKSSENGNVEDHEFSSVATLLSAKFTDLRAPNFRELVCKKNKHKVKRLEKATKGVVKQLDIARLLQR